MTKLVTLNAKMTKVNYSEQMPVQYRVTSPSIPSKSFLIHHSSVILPIDAILSAVLKAFENTPRTNFGGLVIRASWLISVVLYSLYRTMHGI
jgi:hypothetical protein